MATWLSASAGLPFKPMLKSQPARLVLRSYTITRSRQGWETESRGGKRFVRSLSCLSTRLPGKYVETLSDGTTDLWVKSSASSFSPYTLLHELPFFKTTLKQLSFVSSIHTPFWARHMEPVPPPTPHPLPFPTSQLSITTANTGWWLEMPLLIATLMLEQVLTKGLRFQAVSVLVYN